MEERSTGRENLKLIVNIMVSLVILLLCIFLVPRLVLFFMPFVIGWIISCIANPFVVFLERKLKIRRKAGTVVVIICVIAAIEWNRLWAGRRALEAGIWLYRRGSLDVGNGETRF